MKGDSVQDSDLELWRNIMKNYKHSVNNKVVALKQF